MIHALRSLTRRTRVVLALLAAVAVFAGLAVAAAGPAEAAPTAPAAVGDCKEAPKPAKPLGNPLAPGRPGNYSDADPFKKGSDVTIAQVYGNGYAWQTYDNGCKPGSGIMPGVFTGLGNVGLEFSSTWVAWGRMFQTSVITPESWIGKMDPAMAKATKTVADGFWFPWMPVAMLIVAALLLFRSSQGQFAQVVSGLGWSMVVLIIVSGLISYPRDAPRMVDDGIATATTSIATAFSESDMSAEEKKSAEPDVTVEDEKRIQRGDAPKEDKGAAALYAMEQQWDEIDRETSYRTWLAGTFGDPDSATAKKYGPDLFKASHMTWGESKTYNDDPEGKGKEMVEKKQEDYEEVADKIKDADPIAYDHLTGNQGFDRISSSLTGLMTAFITTFFLVFAGLGMAAAYVVIRLLVPFAPAAGPIFLIDKVKDFAMDKLGMVASLIVMGPLYLVTGLVVLRFNSAAMTSDLSTLWKVFVIALAGWLAWKLVKPGALGGRGLGVGRMMRRAAATAAGVRIGNAGNNKRNPDDDEKDESSGQDSPVHDERRPAPYRKFYPGRQPEERGLPAGTAPGPVRETQDLGTIRSEPYPVSSGVFTPRAQQQGALSRRETLALSSGPAPQVDESQRPIHDRRSRPFVSDALPDEESPRTRPFSDGGPASSRVLPLGSTDRDRDDASDPEGLVDEVSDSRRTPTSPGRLGQVEEQRQYRVSGDPAFARLYGGQQPVLGRDDVEELGDKDRLVDDVPRSRENVPPPPVGGRTASEAGPQSTSRARVDAGSDRDLSTEVPSSPTGVPYERSRRVERDVTEETPSQRGGRVMGQDEAIPVDAHEVNYVTDSVTGERVFQVYRPESMRRAD